MNSHQGYMEAFGDSTRVSGLTHNFYRYPARLSPEFVRRAITELTIPGDTILDMYMGGGTTIVESLALGRRAIGIDLNPLACFVTSVKTTPLSSVDITSVSKWADEIVADISTVVAPLAQELRTKNLPVAAVSFFSRALNTLGGLRFPRQRRFARCALLRVGQWGFDSPKPQRQSFDMAERLRFEVRRMSEELGLFVDAANESGFPKNRVTGARTLIEGSSSDPTVGVRILKNGVAPTMVLTSPPYPSVHILYHRWQVAGRRESPAPYWVANLRDGHGASYYTMGSRSPSGLRRYFATLRASFENVREALLPGAFVVQVVAFGDRASQLPQYLQVMNVAGFQEVSVQDNQGGVASRRVPNRKWYATRQGTNDASHELLLVHRKR